MAASGETADRRRTRASGYQSGTPLAIAVRRREVSARRHAGAHPSGAPAGVSCGGRGGRFGPGRRSAQRGNGRDGGGGRPPVCAPSARVTTRGSVTRGRARPKRLPGGDGAQRESAQCAASSRGLHGRARVRMHGAPLLQAVRRGRVPCAFTLDPRSGRGSVPNHCRSRIGRDLPSRVPRSDAAPRRGRGLGASARRN